MAATIYDSYSQTKLQELLKASDEAYADGQPTEMTDAVYDYVKRIYNQRRLITVDKSQTLASISSPTGVGILRERNERNVKLPMTLWSLDNIYYGEGDVARFASTSTSTSTSAEKGYLLSAKMDGISTLYHQGTLYTRGDATTGCDLSHVLPVIKPLPVVNYYVRGEMIMNRKTFLTRFQGKPGRRTIRNSVAGALGAIHNPDLAFLAEIEFIAYEIVVPEGPAPPISEQFAQLIRDGFAVAAHKWIPASALTDIELATYYGDLLETYDYEIDGIVCTVNTSYIRNATKNPSYARAFKQALECLLAPSRVTGIEWNVSAYGYLIPTVLYEPVQICGVRCERAAGESARNIIYQGLGTGAEVEIIYHCKVNPRINQVITPAEIPELPTTGTWEWVPRTQGEPIHIRALGEENKANIQVQQLTRFLDELNVKNVGEGLVQRLYDGGQTTVKHLLTMQPADIRFMGPKISKTIPATIQAAVQSASVVTLMNCSGVFGRGMGSRKLAKLLQAYPDFATWDDWPLEAIQAVEGFAEKTAGVIRQHMPAFRTFLADNGIALPPVGASSASASASAGDVSIPIASAKQDQVLTGKGVCLTGFRDAAITTYLAAVGAKVQTTCNGVTVLLLIGDQDYTNKKTETALKSGIPILTAAEFRNKYIQ